METPINNTSTEDALNGASLPFQKPKVALGLELWSNCILPDGYIKPRYFAKDQAEEDYLESLTLEQREEYLESVIATRRSESLEAYNQSLEACKNHTNFFIQRTGNGWMETAKLKPLPKQLVGSLWHEGEIGICFADTNVGKSILAVQIGDALTNQKSVVGLEASQYSDTVLYFDFEMNAKQFEARYSNGYQDHYQFSDNFHRIEVNPDEAIPDGKDSLKYFLDEFEHHIETQKSIKAKVIIFDNLTFLLSNGNGEQSNYAAALMDKLKRLKEACGISILLLAHTPKRETGKPLTVNDLQGSKMISNFADSIFAIGKSSQSEDGRYIKQLKARNTGIEYGEGNVIVCKIEKPDNFLRFTPQGFAPEYQHLQFTKPVEVDEGRQELKRLVKELAEDGHSQREIAELAGTSAATVNRLLKS